MVALSGPYFDSGQPGLVMILFPHVLIRLLFDADASGAGIVAAASPAFH
jgi:hypothetical protein